MDIREILATDTPSWLKQSLRDIEDSSACETEEATEFIKDTLIAFFDIFNEISEQYMLEDMIIKDNATDKLEGKVIKFLKYIDTDFSYVNMAVTEERIGDLKRLYTIFHKAYFIWLKDVVSMTLHNYKKRKDKVKWLVNQ